MRKLHHDCYSKLAIENLHAYTISHLLIISWCPLDCNRRARWIMRAITQDSGNCVPIRTVYIAATQEASLKQAQHMLLIIGAGDRSRTRDLLITYQLL